MFSVWSNLQFARRLSSGSLIVQHTTIVKIIKTHKNFEAICVFLCTRFSPLGNGKHLNGIWEELSDKIVESLRPFFLFILSA